MVGYEIMHPHPFSFCQRDRAMHTCAGEGHFITDNVTDYKALIPG